MSPPGDRIRVNRWARAAHSQLGTWLGDHGAEYVGRMVTDDGTRDMRWR
ncbi:hypothetical protein [Saccharopolyspora shandongensis]